MKKIFNLIFVLTLISFAIPSCQKWTAPQFEAPVYTGPKANKKIADIKARHLVLDQNVVDSICRASSEKFIVKAVVVSSDEGGNCYKYLTVQDETGGIEIAIDKNSLFNDYPVGQIVYINCQGLVVGDYNNKYQIGWIYENSIGRINAMMLGNYLSKDGLPDMKNIDEMSPCGGICEITGNYDLNPEKVNCLCHISKAKFKADCHGLQLATNDITCDRELENYSITVRTSNYAKFRNFVIDATKEYDLTGILTIYNNDYQFAIRTIDDIKVAPREEEILLQKLTFDANSFTTGGWWQNDENGWQFADNYMYHLFVNSTCDDWMVSPEITIHDNDSYLKIEHHINEVTDPDFYQVYYSTASFDGTIHESDWTPYNLTEYPSSSYFGYSNELTPVPQGVPFRIAIRYNKHTSSIASHRWYIKSLNFYKKEWR